MSTPSIFGCKLYSDNEKMSFSLMSQHNNNDKSNMSTIESLSSSSAGMQMLQIVKSTYFWGSTINGQRLKELNHQRLIQYYPSIFHELKCFHCEMAIIQNRFTGCCAYTTRRSRKMTKSFSENRRTKDLRIFQFNESHFLDYNISEWDLVYVSYKYYCQTNQSTHLFALIPHQFLQDNGIHTNRWCNYNDSNTNDINDSKTAPSCREIVPLQQQQQEEVPMGPTNHWIHLGVCNVCTLRMDLKSHIITYFAWRGWSIQTDQFNHWHIDIFMDSVTDRNEQQSRCYRYQHPKQKK
jgi:hypothetical protein